MPRGGPRPNSGAPRGPRTRKIDPRVVNSGLLPLEMILITSRRMWMEATDDEGRIIELSKAKEAALFAKEALPYTSAKLQTLIPADATRAPEVLAQQIRQALNSMDDAVPVKTAEPLPDKLTEMATVFAERDAAREAKKTEQLN